MTYKKPSLAEDPMIIGSYPENHGRLFNRKPTQNELICECANQSDFTGFNPFFVAGEIRFMTESIVVPDHIPNFGRFATVYWVNHHRLMLKKTSNGRGQRTGSDGIAPSLGIAPLSQGA